jgi:sialic acid synthase SpsE/mannose-6-phosphate isomerase-like protein (cupin superfamily)
VKAMNFDFLKVASCSATDFALLDEVKKVDMPTVISTGGLSFSQMDNLVGFFSNKKDSLALLHCVALYPTQNAQLTLGRIAKMKACYPQIPIGFSSHEKPDNYASIQMAYASGARIFEKHVGISTEKNPLNAYSASPEQIERWIAAWNEAKEACNLQLDSRSETLELFELNKLKRGYIAKLNLKADQKLEPQFCSLALSILPDKQILADKEVKTLTVNRDIQKGEPILDSDIVLAPNYSPKETLRSIQELLKRGGIPLENLKKLELSHHHGIHSFPKIGATFLEFEGNVNAKIIALLPSQQHPSHIHSSRKEKFRILYGDVDLVIDDKVHQLNQGDEIWIPNSCWHNFSSKFGALIEETYIEEIFDSIYADEDIQRAPQNERKTSIAISELNPNI